MVFRRAAIVGLGLIGGSAGMAWRRRGAVGEVVGVARRPEQIGRAQALGAIDRGTTDLAAGVEGADVVLLATPVGVALALAEAVAAAAQPAALVMDVGSTKADVCRRFHATGVTFVGGHPMAGSERKGIEAADPYLFENAVWVLTPLADTSGDTRAKAAELVALSGAHPVWLDPDLHDAWVARVSHLPQLAALALVATAGEDEGALALAGGGFRDTTRIAQSSPEMWLDVFASNRGPVLRALERFSAHLEALRQAVDVGDRAALAASFRLAALARERMPRRTKGLLPGYHDLVMFVPDRPGVIGALATALGGRGVNIQDIEILRLREGEGGTLRLGFSTADEAEKALGVLAEQGIAAQRR